jgi:hypothetical protein
MREPAAPSTLATVEMINNTADTPSPLRSLPPTRRRKIASSNSARYRLDVLRCQEELSSNV